ncbi:MAG: DUF2933 domain-containing protein [bacterium]|nr:DUF2933 domain-containing protein [bacterium]
MDHTEHAGTGPLAPATSRRRLWFSLLCLAPIAALVPTFAFGIPISSVLVWALILLCPLSHLLHRHGGHGGGHAASPRASTPADRADD